MKSSQDKASARRHNIQLFDSFYQKAGNIFKEFGEKDLRAHDFERTHMLAICPGSRNGGTDRRVVEIFWGSSRFESMMEGRTWKALSEHGASLLFQRNDTGQVLITLFPAYTENRKPVEDSICLKLWINPKNLANRRLLLQVWNDFMAYMESTCLDGQPSFWQRFRVWYLRNFKHLVINNRWQPTKFLESVWSITEWGLKVGLSGAIIYAASFLNQPSSTGIEQRLDRINESIKAISDQLNAHSNK